MRYSGITTCRLPGSTLVDLCLFFFFKVCVVAGPRCFGFILPLLLAHVPGAVLKDRHFERPTAVGKL